MGTAKSRMSSGCGCPVRESSKATASCRGKELLGKQGREQHWHPNPPLSLLWLQGRPFQLSYRSSWNCPITAMGLPGCTEFRFITFTGN